jgi:gamma-glutamyl hercynylcysteine S-oxide hydrolase
MCRQLAYLGPAVPLAELILDPPHSLHRQSYAPADMRGGGTVNADGFGVGWFPAGGGTAVRYRRAVPIWTDASLPGLLASTRAGAVLAAVRSATVGMPLVETACAPFTDGRWLFSLNGKLTGWPDSAAKLAEQLPVTDLLTLDSACDAALLWALVRHRLRAGVVPAEALAGVVADAVAAAPESRLNLLVADGESVAATTWTHALSVRRTADSVAVSSEPWDLDDTTSWQAVPDRQLVSATRTTLEITPLEGRS